MRRAYARVGFLAMFLALLFPFLVPFLLLSLPLALSALYLHDRTLVALILATLALPFLLLQTGQLIDVPMDISKP